MKRDMDLARAILLYVEEQDYKESGVEVNLENYPDKQIFYHVMLLTEAELLLSRRIAEMGSEEAWYPIRLTWSGHEFIELARSETQFENAKRTVLQKTGGLAFSILQRVLSQLASEAIQGRVS